MKRLLCLFAVLILALTGPLSCWAEPAATAAVSPRTYFADTMLTATLLTREAVYAKGFDGRVMRQGWTEEEPTTLCRLLPEGENWRNWDWERMDADPNAASVLVAGDGALWAVYRDQVGTVDAEGITWRVTMRDEPGGWGVQWRFVRNGVLYGLADYTDQENKELEWNYSVLAVELSTGALRRVKTPGAYAITPYRDETLLLLRLRQDGTAYLSRLDMKTEALTGVEIALPDGPVTGLSWDGETDALAVLTEKYVWLSQAGGAFEKSADLLPLPGFGIEMIRATLTAGGGYALQFGDIQALPLGTHSDADKIALTLVSSFGDRQAQRTFLIRHPQVDLTVQDGAGVLTPADVAGRVRAGDTADVFGVWFTSGFSALIAKGYAAPIDAGLNTPGLLPGVRDRLTNDAGQPCAGLLRLSIGLRRVNRELWRETLGDTPAPRTWREFLLLQKDRIEAEDGLLLTDYFSCEDTFWQIMQAWIGRALATGQPLDFTDPLLGDTLAALGQVRHALDERGLTVLDEMALYPESEIGGVYSLLWGQAADFALGYTAEELGDVVLPFTFAAEDTPILSAQGQALVVNPLSGSPALAKELVAAYVADWQDSRQRALLYPDAAVPVERESWQARNEEWTASRDALTAQLAAAQGEAAAALQAQLEEVQARIAQNDLYRWEVSADGLAWWKTCAGYVRLFDDTLICDADSPTGEPLMQLGLRWLDGQISLDEMLNRFQQTAALIAAEGA